MLCGQERKGLALALAHFKGSRCHVRAEQKLLDGLWWRVDFEPPSEKKSTILADFIPMCAVLGGDRIPSLAAITSKLARVDSIAQWRRGVLRGAFSATLRTIPSRDTAGKSRKSPQGTLRKTPGEDAATWYRTAFTCVGKFFQSAPDDSHMPRLSRA